MRHAMFIVTVLCAVLAVAFARAMPQSIAENKAKAAAAPTPRVPFQSNPSFDEIVVESSLTVRGKPAGARNGRTKLMLVTDKPAAVQASG
ncbi:hypothetical protein WDU94_004417 [Cyamophila willieti]